MLSIAIPLYNKASSLEETLRSCAENCRVSGINFEIVILNNASTDATPEEIEAIANQFPEASCIHLHQTISAQDNWLLSLNSCKGEYLKLQLADDIMPAFNISEVIQVLSSSDTDYVVGRTTAVFRGTDFRTVYFDLVNSFRSCIHNRLTDREKMGLLVTEGRIFDSHNPFGDPNALILHRRCLSSLNWDIRSIMPAFTVAPDVDLYLNLFANHTGSYVDCVMSYFYYYESSPCVRRVYEPGYDHEGLRMLERLLPLYFISSSKFLGLKKYMTREQKEVAVTNILKITKECLGIEVDSTQARHQFQTQLIQGLRRLILAKDTYQGRFMHRIKQILAG